ncbi:hypothetical protein N8973_00725, partial [bacterium]|nr:hypothetical protein [bacterium]
HGQQYLKFLRWPVLQVGIQGKDLVCGWVGSLAVPISPQTTVNYICRQLHSLMLLLIWRF